MNSMTGYGKATVAREGKEITVELKSVNHRYLDISVKMPRTLLSQEDFVRKTLSNKLLRGHIDVYVNYADKQTGGKQAVVDIPLAASILDQCNQLSEVLGVSNDMKVSALVRSPEVITYTSAPCDTQTLSDMLEEALFQANEELCQSRAVEGQKIYTVLFDRLGEIKVLVDKVRTHAPQVVAEFRQKLADRISEVLQGVEIDQTRLLNEVAFFADKSNIDEELDRLDAHISHAYALIEQTDGVGRKLDFLIQEMNREANTICSKSNNLEITAQGVLLKNEIEKLREQCQNVE